GEGPVLAGPADAAFRAAKLAPLVLEAKEGLALINGTHLMAAQGALVLCDFDRLFDAALVACAMSIDACKATDAFLDPRVFIALPLDAITLAIAHIAGISERRTYYLLAATDSENPIPAYLSPQPGLHSGLMVAQYTAAACCNEIQGLCTPASVANLSTSAGME